MNVSRFFEHWGIAEDPFRAEEARQDPIFLRLDEPIGHPDLEKIIGDVSRPSTAIVFGEKGSGKTAIRLQLERRIHRHNEANPESPVVLVAYDDLNPVLDRFHDRIGEDDPLASLRRLGLVDNLDAALCHAVTPLIDALLDVGRSDTSMSVLRARRRQARRLDRESKDDLLALQACYDASDLSMERAQRIRRVVRAPFDRAKLAWFGLIVGAWLLPAAAFALWWWSERPPLAGVWLWLLGAALAVPVLLTAKRAILDSWRLKLGARRVLHHARTLPRSRERMAEHLERLPVRVRRSHRLPIGDDA